MALRDKRFVPMTVKEEPMDDSYDVGFTVTDLNDEDIKIEVKNEPVDDSDFFGNEVPVVEKSPKSVKEVVQPRRTSRKSTNTLVTQNADALLQKTQILKKTFELDEISCMTGKQLVENFAEMESNEKFFSFTCSIMPEICGNFFTSYGSDNDARAKMQRHLVQHVKDLVAEKQKDKNFVFAADTLLLYAADEDVIPVVPIVKKPRGRRPATRSANKSTKAGSEKEQLNNLKGESEFDVIDLNDVQIENLLMENQEEEEEKLKSPQSLRAEKLKSPRSVPSEKLKSPQSEKTSPPKLKRARRMKFYDDEWNVQKKTTRGKKEKIVMELSGLLPRRCIVSETSEVNKEKDKFRRHECTEKSPWCLDHTYDIHHYNPLREAQIKGKELDADLQYYHKFMPAFKTQTISEIKDHMLTRLLFTMNPDEGTNPSKLIIPILTVSATSMSRDMNGLPNNPMEECDDIDLPPLKFNNCGPLAALKQNLPKGRPEFEVYRELDFNLDVTEEEIKAIEALKGNWTGDHIKILSKYYLRELEMNKGKNRRKKALCGCKICPNKKFTAVTTLYYHYISHTGEKPFKCNKCDKGFTRRHSLNYHAMTHSNINRFKCPICLKQFRHTSHYKDHVKHHTGEEECHCKMCNTTFKSRTAFNRHLKTKHNLTITGSNKVSRVLSPSKINQLHNQEMAANEDPSLQGMLDNAGAVSTNKRKEIKSVDIPSLMVIKGEPSTEMMDIDSILPSNVIHIQPEDMDCSEFSMENIFKRRKPSILKPRFSTPKF